MPPQNEHAELKRLLELNSKLVAENNRLVKKLYHWTIGGMALRVVWYILLIGLPFALYFYVLEPYFAAFGSNYETFLVGINEIPGLKGLDQVIRETFNQN